MYAQKLLVNVVIRGERRACPLEWLDQFCMRNFTTLLNLTTRCPSAMDKWKRVFGLRRNVFRKDWQDG